MSVKRSILSLCAFLSLAVAGQAQDQDLDQPPELGQLRVKRLQRLNPYLEQSGFAERFTNSNVKLSPVDKNVFIESLLFDELRLSTPKCGADDETQNCPNRADEDPRTEDLGLPLNIFRFPFPENEFAPLTGQQVNLLDGKQPQVVNSESFSIQKFYRYFWAIQDDFRQAEGKPFPIVNNTNSVTTILEVHGDGSSGFIASTAGGFPSAPIATAAPFGLQVPVLYFNQEDSETPYRALVPPLAGKQLEILSSNDTTPVAAQIDYWWPTHVQTSFQKGTNTPETVLVVFAVQSFSTAGDLVFQTPIGNVMVLFDLSDLELISAKPVTRPDGFLYNVADRHAFLNDTASRILFRERDAKVPGVDPLKIIDCAADFSCEESSRPVPRTPEGKTHLFLANANSDFSTILTVSTAASGHKEDLTQGEGQFDALARYERFGLNGVNREVELHRYDGETDSYLRSVISQFPSGDPIPSCYDQCLEQRIVDGPRACASICTTIAGSNGSVIPLIPAEGPGVDFSPGSFDATTEFFIEGAPRPGPGFFGLAEKEFPDGPGTVVTFLMNPVPDFYRGDLAIPYRLNNLFAAFVPNDGEISTALLTPREEGRKLLQHRPLLPFRNALSSDGETVAFIAPGEIGEFGSSSGQVFLATLTRESEVQFVRKIEDVVDDIDEDIEDEESKPIVTIPGDEDGGDDDSGDDDSGDDGDPDEDDQPKNRRPVIEVPTSFLRELYDALREEGIALRKRTERKLERILNILGVDAVETLSSDAITNPGFKKPKRKKKKRKRKKVRSDIRFQVRIEQNIGTDESGNIIWKRIRKGVSKTRSIAKFRLPKLAPGSYRAFYRVKISRVGREKAGRTTDFSQPSGFEIQR